MNVERTAIDRECAYFFSTDARFPFVAAVDGQCARAVDGQVGIVVSAQLDAPSGMERLALAESKRHGAFDDDARVDVRVLSYLIRLCATRLALCALMSFVHYFVSLDTRIYEPNVMDLAGFRLQRYNILEYYSNFYATIFKKANKPLHISSACKRAGTCAHESLLIDCWRDVLSKNGEYINQRGRMS